MYRVSHKKVYLFTAFSYESNTVTKTVLLYINEIGNENKDYFYQSICSIRHLTRTILFRAVNFLTEEIGSFIKYSNNNKTVFAKKCVFKIPIE